MKNFKIPKFQNFALPLASSVPFSWALGRKSKFGSHHFLPHPLFLKRYDMTPPPLGGERFGANPNSWVWSEPEGRGVQITRPNYLQGDNFTLEILCRSVKQVKN